MRAFVAVEITDESILHIIKKFQNDLKIQAKPVEVKNIHFTLQFLGDISESSNEDIQKALKSIDFQSFSLSFQGVGAFPKPRFPRVVWVGTDDVGGNHLIDLAHKVENVLSPLGFKCDKPFKPHITIFRIKSKIGDITKDLKKYQNMEFGSQKITQIILKKSVLTSDGPIYSNLLVVDAR